MYFGSVRFFKHIILATLALLIIVPLGCAVFLVFKSQKLSLELNSVKALAADYQKKSDEPIEIIEDTGETDAIVAAEHKVQDEKEKEIAPISESMGYQLDYPNLYAPTTKKVKSDGEKIVYLTFDDGPSQQTPKVLDILDKENIKATFFVVYHDDDFSNSIYKEIVNRGHTIAVHTASHDYKKIYESVDSFLEDFNKMHQHIYDITGVKAELFRFPGGSINAYNEEIYQPIIGEMVRRGFTFHDWNVSSGDASNRATKESVLKNTVDNVKKKDKSVVLMHDSIHRDSTVEVLPQIISEIKKAGYSFDKLDASVAPFLFSYTE